MRIPGKRAIFSIVGGTGRLHPAVMSSKKLPIPVMVLFALFFWLSAIVLNVVAGRVENGEIVRIFALVDAIAAAVITVVILLRTMKGSR